MTVYWPNGSLTRPRVSSDFDAARKNPVTGIVQPHNGIDLIGWADNCSPVDGTVVFAGYNGGAGNEVRIRADGPTAFHVGDHYRLLHHARLYVRTGERVKARQPVGRMGTTGQSTGVHCHFETHEWRLWNPVNPSDYMARANAGTPAGGDAKPFDPKGFLMALTDEEQSELLSAARDMAALKAALLNGRKDDSRVAPWESPFDVLLTRVIDTNNKVTIPGSPQWSLVQQVGQTANAILAIVSNGAEVDEAELAKSLAPALAPLLADNLGTLSDGTVDELVKRLLDEQSRRLAS